MPEPVLRLEGISLHYGGIAAVDGVGFEVGTGESLAIIGPNGAGKSSLVNLISGARRASSGAIFFQGRAITELSADARARLGIGRTYQIPRPFARMSVRENLQVAAAHAGGEHSHGLARQRCDELLQRCGLRDVAASPAGALPLLRRKRLELARALALRPRLLLLDEIGAGLIEGETTSLIELILDLKREIESIVLIEHVMDVVARCCERTAVLAAGRLLLLGPTPKVLRDPALSELYLGTGHMATEADTRARPSHSPPTPLLSVQSVSVHYAGVRALREVSLRIDAGEVVTLLGANGAGKTTLARAISGAATVSSGVIELGGERIDTLAPERITARGISHCMEGRRVFAGLSVQENLLLALPRSAYRDRAQRLRGAYELFPTLAGLRTRAGTAISGGQQQMLAVARALMAHPRLVLFDEISLGLAPVVIEQLYAALAQLRRRGVAMLLIEQDINRGLSLADRAYVLRHGEVRLEGAPQSIQDSPALRELYVGVER